MESGLARTAMRITQYERLDAYVHGVKRSLDKATRKSVSHSNSEPDSATPQTNGFGSGGAAAAKGGDVVEDAFLASLAATPNGRHDAK